MRRVIGLLGVIILVIAVAAAWSPAGAQFGGLTNKLKKKAQDKVGQKVGDALDKPKSKDGSDKTPAQPGEESAEAADKPAAAAAGGTATSEDMTLYTRYDFIPGDKVIFYDDLSKEEMGEFPSRWGLNEGVFEVARQHERNWILCTNNGSIYPKVPKGEMPPKYTIELDLYASVGGDNRGHWTRIEWVDEQGNDIAAFGIREYDDTHLRILGNDLAGKQLSTPLTRGVHTMRVMATRTSMKCYIDNERVANVPAVEGFKPVGFRVYLQMFGASARPDNPALFGALRYAEGGKTMREQLAETGRVVTHGILFDSGSDKIRAESYKTLADIGGLLTEDAALRISIEGHTDSDGADAANLTLSQNRANAVKNYLVATYKVEAGRLEAKGWGEGKPIDTNNTPEGKANNRRVELVKL
jgi:OmpA-OmpF porin, OOP family